MWAGEGRGREGMEVVGLVQAGVEGGGVEAEVVTAPAVTTAVEWYPLCRWSRAQQQKSSRYLMRLPH